MLVQTACPGERLDGRVPSSDRMFSVQVTTAVWDRRRRAGTS